MNTFRVWLQPTGNLCRVRVDGMQNACWLLARLSHSFVFKTLEPIRPEQGSSICAFQVLCSGASRAQLKSLLESIPPVQLMAAN
jgi:hypothetical protein